MLFRVPPVCSPCPNNRCPDAVDVEQYGPGSGVGSDTVVVVVVVVAGGLGYLSGRAVQGTRGILT